MKQDVFISYSFEDKQEAESILRALESNDIRCWIAPRDIIPGTPWAESIVEAIGDSRLLLLLLTDHSNDSLQILRELERASSEKLTILAVKRSVSPVKKSIIYYLGTHQWLDATDPILDEQLPRIVKAVKAGLKSEPPQTKIFQENEHDPVPALENDLLSNYSDDEFGGGERLISTGFLVYGLLSFWIYNVVVLYRNIERHIASRRKAFLEKIVNQNITEKDHEHLRTILERGFKTGRAMKMIPLVFFSISYFLVIVEIISQHLFALNYISETIFSALTIGAILFAAILFFSGSLYLLLITSRTMKNHEYNELLLFELASNPLHFKMLSPSKSFLMKWNKTQNFVTLFLIFSVPLIVSPVAAVIHIIRDRIQQGGYSNAEINETIVTWTIVVAVCSVIFHYFGTTLLLKLYNEHLETEKSYLSNKYRFNKS